MMRIHRPTGELPHFDLTEKDAAELIAQLASGLAELQKRGQVSGRCPPMTFFKVPVVERKKGEDYDRTGMMIIHIYKEEQDA